jgi:hypothetical protein
MWNDVLGPSWSLPETGVVDWVAGALAANPQDWCARPFSRPDAVVAMTQYVVDDLDTDYVCAVPRKSSSPQLALRIDTPTRARRQPGVSARPKARVASSARPKGQRTPRLALAQSVPLPSSIFTTVARAKPDQRSVATISPLGNPPLHQPPLPPLSIEDSDSAPVAPAAESHEPTAQASQETQATPVPTGRGKAHDLLQAPPLPVLIVEHQGSVLDSGFEASPLNGPLAPVRDLVGPGPQ